MNLFLYVVRYLVQVSYIVRVQYYGMMIIKYNNSRTARSPTPARRVALKTRRSSVVWELGMVIPHFCCLVLLVVLVLR